MQQLIICTMLLICNFSAFSQDNKRAGQDTILLTGASFASPGNGWFELGCEKLNAFPINRAVGGEAISNAANRMQKGTLYTPQELESIDVFVIMQVHDKDVYNSGKLHEKYTDYKMPFDRSDYAAAFDYVIKKYLSDCYNLKFDKNSRYYNSKYGKPARIVLCTDWHDARSAYNTSIRKLAEKWGFPLVEFDKYIGFSKNTVHPVTGVQASLMFALDTQNIDGIKYGWHPEQGKDKYIQKRMGAIFADVLSRILL